MSFGFGGQQGTVRYALMVDDAQATQSINRFKSNLTSLANPTNTITQNMGKLNQTFSAGVTPLKSQGDALATLKNNLNSTGTTATTLGTKIKDTASKFAGFATGLGVTASGVLQLAAGFRDYNDAQIAVDRQTRKLSLAQEAVTKTTDKLNALTSKGVKSGKEYQQAQLDVTQAQQNLSVQTDLLGEAQERMFDSQTQFVASVIPTTLGAIGTLGSAFKDLGLKSTSLTGFLTKLGIEAPIAGTGLKGLGASAFTAAGGLAGMVALAGPIAGLVKTLLVAGELLPKTGELFMGNIETRLATAKTWLEKLKELPIFGGTADILDKLAGISPEIDKIGKSSAAATKPVEQFSSGIKIFAGSLKDTTKIGSEVPKIQNAIVASFLTGSPAANDYSNMLIDLNKNVFENKTITGQQAKALTNIPDKFKTASTFASLFGDKTKIAADVQTDLRAKLDATNVGMDSLNTAIQTGADNFSNFISQTELGVVTAKAYRDRLVDWATTQLKIPNAMKLTNEQLELQIKAAKDDTTAIKQLNDALTNAASQGFNDFIESTKNILGEKKFGKLGIVDSFNRIQKEADKFQTNFIKAMDKGGTEGAKIFALKFSETPKKFIKPRDVVAFDSLITWIKANGGLPADEFVKQLAAKWKDLAPEAQAKFGQLMAGFPDVAGQIGTDSGTSLITSLNDQLKAFKPDKGFLTALDLITGQVTQIKKVKISKKDQKWSDKLIKQNKGSTGQQGAYGGPQASVITETTKMLTDNTDSLNKVAAVNTAIMALDKLKPQISLQNRNAIGVISTTESEINKLTKLKPQISLQNRNAISAISTVEGEIKNLTKLKPQISLQNRNAINAIQTVESEIKKLENIKPNIKVSFSGTGTLHASGSASLSSGGKITISQHGQKELLTEDKTIMAHRGEFVAIGKPEQGKIWNTGLPGGGGGDIVVNLNISGNEIVNEQRITRRVKRNLGSNTYTLGR